MVSGRGGLAFASAFASRYRVICSIWLSQALSYAEPVGPGSGSAGLQISRVPGESFHSGRRSGAQLTWTMIPLRLFAMFAVVNRFGSLRLEEGGDDPRGEPGSGFRPCDFADPLARHHRVGMGAFPTAPTPCLI